MSAETANSTITPPNSPLEEEEEDLLLPISIFGISILGASCLHRTS
ncbi:unnamed protein product [Brassica oleracea]